MVKISVLIPVYNAENFIYEALSSVLNQTLGDIELICVNTESKDRSLKILEKFAKADKRVKIINQKNLGCGAAKNRALDEVTGDYIYFFDPEDYILPDAFEKSYISAIKNDSDIVVVKVAKIADGETIDYCEPSFDFESDFGKDVDFENFSFNIREAKRHVLNSSFDLHAKLYKREFLEIYEDFKFLNLPFEDVLFHVKSMLRASKISYISDYLYHSRLSDSSYLNDTSNNAIFIRDIIDMVEQFLKENNYWDDFFKEFYLFKADQIFSHILSADSEDYYQWARKELLELQEEMKKHNVSNSILYEEHLMYYDFIPTSNTLEEFKLNVEIQNINHEIINLKKDNKKLSNQKKKLQKQNKDILNSHSWKLTNPLRKLMGKH